MSEWRECCILRVLWRVHQKAILCKVFEFGSVQMFFDVLNNKFDIAVKFFLNRGYTHILTSQKTAVILRIYFEHGLFHRLSHSWQVIASTNRIWPDLISPWRICNDKLYRAPLKTPGDDVGLAREGCRDIIASPTAWVRVVISKMAAFRFR